MDATINPPDSDRRTTNTSELKREKRYEIEKKKLQWKLAQPLGVSWSPCIFLFPSTVIPQSSLRSQIAASSANWQILRARLAFLQRHKTLVSSCKDSFILPGTHSSIINCGVSNISFNLEPHFWTYGSSTGKSKHPQKVRKKLGNATTNKSDWTWLKSVPKIQLFCLVHLFSQRAL